MDGAGHSQELRHYSNTHLIALTLIADNKDGLPKLLDAVAELAAEVHTSFGLSPKSLEACLPPPLLRDPALRLRACARPILLGAC